LEREVVTSERLKLLAIFLAITIGNASAAARGKIVVDRAGHGFVDAAGKAFVPMGVTYYRPGTGWAPQLWKEFDPEATRKDFAELARRGMHVVRVFLSWTSFVREDGSLNPDGIAKFDQFLDLADEAGLYVQPTGPDHWEGTPAWAKGDRFSDEHLLVLQEKFWRAFVARYRGRATIFAYELLNEPSVPWTSDAMAARWKHAIPDPHGAASSHELLRYQHFRESRAEEWVSRQAKAVRESDPGALVTVGLLQWSFPVMRMPVEQYTGFRPSHIAKSLEFIEIHFYPLTGGVYRYDGAEAETRNLACLESMAREAALTNLPVVIGEFGWYGGGPLDAKTQAASEDQQAQWCQHVVDATRPIACGWLNWGMYDDPQATDVSRFTGLLTADGHEKAWGRAFTQDAKEFSTNTSAYHLPDRPACPWDQCITDPAAMEQFRRSYLESFKSASK
jgi:hypothetical protein